MYLTPRAKQEFSKIASHILDELCLSSEGVASESPFIKVDSDVFNTEN